MQVKVWANFKKRKNSTKIPATGTGTTLTAVLKDNTGILNPVIELAGYGYVPTTYVHIPDFGRYYFVTDSTYNRGVNVLTLKADPMASFKSDIGGTSALIARSSDTNFYNKYITDPLNSLTNNIVKSSVSDSYSALFGGDTYILTVVAEPPAGSQDAISGFCRTYALTEGDMAGLAAAIVTPTFLNSIKAMFSDPMSVIISCFYTKFAYLSIPGNQERIKLAGVDTGVDAKLISSRIYTHGQVNKALPSAYGDYRDAPPYTTISCHLPYVGVVPVDYAIVADDWTLHYDFAIDLCTGDIVYKFINSDGTVCASYDGNVFTGCPVSAQSFNAIARVGGIATFIGGVSVAAAGLATGGLASVPMGAVATAAAGAATSLSSAEIHTQTNGALSSALGSYTSRSVEICVYTQLPIRDIESAKDQIGMRVDKVDQVSLHTGYLQLYNAHISCSALDAEREEIDNTVNSGFYYE